MMTSLLEQCMYEVAYSGKCLFSDGIKHLHCKGVNIVCITIRNVIVREIPTHEIVSIPGQIMSGTTSIVTGGAGMSVGACQMKHYEAFCFAIMLKQDPEHIQNNGCAILG